MTLPLLFGAAPASAQSYHGPAYPRPYIQDERVPPNVPDRNGCVRQCELDLNPCDPPIYKKLDGRCTLKD